MKLNEWNEEEWFHENFSSKTEFFFVKSIYIPTLLHILWIFFFLKKKKKKKKKFVLTENCNKILTNSFSRKILCTLRKNLLEVLSSLITWKLTSQVIFQIKLFWRNFLSKTHFYLVFTGWAQEFGRCEPGPCELIPGLVYDADTNQCAWPDEVGCSLDGMYFLKNLAFFFVSNIYWNWFIDS